MRWRDALGVSADAIAVGAFIVGLVAVVVVAVSAVNDKLALGLGIALVMSVVVNAVLLVRRRPKPTPPPNPMVAVLAAMAAPGPKYRVPPMERLTASSVLEYMNEAMDRFEFDNAHGLDKAGDEARKAARDAKAKAEGISDAIVRDTVRLFEEAIIHSPRGWKERGGANLAQMNAVRDAHTIAVKIVGALLRPIAPEPAATSES